MREHPEIGRAHLRPAAHVARLHADHPPPPRALGWRRLPRRPAAARPSRSVPASSPSPTPSTRSCAGGPIGAPRSAGGGVRRDPQARSGKQFDPGLARLFIEEAERHGVGRRARAWTCRPRRCSARRCRSSRAPRQRLTRTPAAVPRRHGPSRPGPVRYHALRLVLKAHPAGLRPQRACRGCGATSRQPGRTSSASTTRPGWTRRSSRPSGPTASGASTSSGRASRTCGAGLAQPPHPLDASRRALQAGRPRTSSTSTRRAVAVLRIGSLPRGGRGGAPQRPRGRASCPLETGPRPLRPPGRRTRSCPPRSIGTRWIHLGSRVRIRIGEPVHPDGFGRGKAGAAAMTAIVQERLSALLEGVVEREPPGWFGRTISEAFNDRS